MEFSKSVYCGYLIRGDLPGAMDYVRQFPEQGELFRKFQARFEQGENAVYAVDDGLNAILAAYQRYYRDVFYHQCGKPEAEARLREGLAGPLAITDKTVGVDELERVHVAAAVNGRGFHFLGGLTGGYYGPYIWKTTETRRYEVELPDGVQTYTVNILDGFVSRSWLDYLSFGETGTGGWTGSDGVINCVRSAYDFDSESFRVSLLKHEAQHARDLKQKPDMSSEDLEYRAKLVELIYSVERNLLERFAQEADSSDRRNGHAAASHRIVEGIAGLLGRAPAEAAGLPAGEIRAAAETLFRESSGLAEPSPNRIRH